MLGPGIGDALRRCWRRRSHRATLGLPLCLHGTAGVSSYNLNSTSLLQILSFVFVSYPRSIHSYLLSLHLHLH